MNDTPAERERAIRLSLRAYVGGLMSLIPVLGFIPAFYAILLWRRIPRDVWNPAAGYLHIGITLSVWSTLCFLLLSAAILVELA